MPAPADTPAEGRQPSTSFGPSHPSSHFSIKLTLKFTKLSQIKPNQQCDLEASDRRTDTDSEVKFLPVNTATKMMTE